MKRFLAVLLCLLLILSAASATEVSELRGYKKGAKSPYQYVFLGTYPYEKDGTRARVMWRILSVDDGIALLLTENIIDVQQIIFVDNEKDSDKYNYRRINAYNESDMYVWINSVMLDDLCSEGDFRAALIETENGLIYPPTTSWMRNTAYGFANTTATKPSSTRLAWGTEYAKHHKLYENFGNKKSTLNIAGSRQASPYWVNHIKDPKAVKMQIAGYDGHLSYGTYSRVNIGLRPATQVDLGKLKIIGGSGTKQDPYELRIRDEFVGASAADTQPAEIEDDETTETTDE